MLSAQPLPLHKNWGEQRIRAASACDAFSMLPNDAQNITIEWQGPCENGLAHGNGIQVTRLKNIPLSVSQAVYFQGRVATYDDRYFFELGNLYLKKGNHPTSSVAVSLQALPTWAQALAPASDAWIEWRRQDIQARQAEVAAVYGNTSDMEAMENDSETSDEKNPVSSEKMFETHRIF